MPSIAPPAEFACREDASVVGCDINTTEDDKAVHSVRDLGEMIGIAPLDLGDSAVACQWIADAVEVHRHVYVLCNDSAARRGECPVRWWK